MNALASNLVVCAWPGDCCQPGTMSVWVGWGMNAACLEFCPRHVRRAFRRWRK